MMLEWRVHGYHWSKGIVHSSRVKNRTLFSLFGLVPIIFLLFIMLAACGGSSPSTSGPSVSAIDNVYSPKELHIKPGEMVTWINNGQASHTVT
ncbi:MAG TPA: hypothetical protein VEL49_08060, partial [Ktedonobacteraceae bacterium]|nr:hypothetical protein [Ktedonobacteraceae bacterium]